MNITVTVRLLVSSIVVFTGRLTRMTGDKTTRELVYETNRDVKWICKMLQDMEARDEDFESRLRALEGWRAEKAGEERRLSTMSAGAGGVVGGVVAVIVRVLGGG
ncbi:MAG: hypothetical protein M0P21_10810 [Methanoculleus sp.]|nr:hypothetical protein [Methanoculleus sp.]